MSVWLKMKCARLAVVYAKDDLISIRFANNNFWTKVQLSTKSVAFYRPIFCCL